MFKLRTVTMEKQSGVAYLYRKNLKQRAKALINIARPGDRRIWKTPALIGLSVFKYALSIRLFYFHQINVRFILSLL